MNVLAGPRLCLSFPDRDLVLIEIFYLSLVGAPLLFRIETHLFLFASFHYGPPSSCAFLSFLAFCVNLGLFFFTAPSGTECL